jgi:predicted RNase H-like nuclease (RuvC/YqgF family)
METKVASVEIERDELKGLCESLMSKSRELEGDRS